MTTDFSRQIGTFGKNTMEKISNLKPLIIGCDTIGMECCKSLVLMGISNIYIHDANTYDKKYTGRLIYKPSKNKLKLHTVCSEFLKILNPVVNVHIISNITINNIDKLIKLENISGIINTLNQTTNEIENICVNNKIPYLFGYNTEFIGYVFSNFGQWKVMDINGENTLSGYIDNYEIKNNITLYVHDCKKLPISNNFILKTKNKSIQCTSASFDLIKDIDLNQSTLKITVKYDEELETLLLNNNNINYEENKDVIDMEYKTHSNITKTHSYNLIKLNSSFQTDDHLYDNYMEFLNKNTNTSFKQARGFIDKDIKFYPLGTIIGNILAQEVIKFTGKYMPLNQELLFDYTGLYSTNRYLSKNQDLYDMYSLLDKNLIKKIKETNAFMVGCGALGCELSKNMAIMGFCQSSKGLLTTTDMDSIELSNLSRQFLFQHDDIGKMKSAILKDKINKYFPKTNINSLDKELCKETEHIFNSNFWKNKNIVINALDNIEARSYVDKKCYIHEKPLFESGTLGNKANSQVIIPFKTATYSEIIDPVMEEIPMCTIKNFPNNVNHCIEWGLDVFHKIFTQVLLDLQIYIDSADRYVDMLIKIENENIKNERLSNLVMFIRACSDILENKLSNITSYITYLYKVYYYKPVHEILNMYPFDHKNQEGQMFWIGKRLKPELYPISVVPINFIKSITCIITDILNINNISFPDCIQYPSMDTFNLEINLFNINDLYQSYSYIKSKFINFNDMISNVEYDKDNNLHLDCMVNIVNLRCKMYGIKEEDHLNIKINSGKIVPSICTTTSIISGFVLIDILKYLSQNNFKYTESNINLAINKYNIYDALKPKITYNNMYNTEYGINIKTIPYDFNTWSRIQINGKYDYINNVSELVKYLYDQYQIDSHMLNVDNLIIYNHKFKKELSMMELYNQLRLQYSDYIIINITTYNNKDIPILTPPIVYSFI